MPRQHKQFHFTGLYGIILLIPALIFFYGFKANVLVTANAIPIEIKDCDAGRMVYYTRTNPEFKTFRFIGKEKVDLKALKEARRAIKQMMATHDTITGIKIKLDPRGSYNAFIQAYSLMTEEHVASYGMDGDTIWAICASKEEKKLWEPCE